MRTPAAVQGLVDLVTWIKNKGYNTKRMSMVEIGVFQGDSTKVFCQYFRKVTAVDPWESDIGDITSMCDMQKVFEDFAESMGTVLNLNVIRDYSYNVVSNYRDESLDMVYIDGSHEYKDVKRDIVDWLPKVKKGGIIAGHDFRDKFKGVKKAVAETVGKPDATFKDSSWVVVKK